MYSCRAFSAHYLAGERDCQCYALLGRCLAGEIILESNGARCARSIDFREECIRVACFGGGKRFFDGLVFAPDMKRTQNRTVRALLELSGSGGVSKIDKHKPADSTCYLIHKPAGLAEMAVFRSLRHAGNINL